MIRIRRLLDEPRNDWIIGTCLLICTTASALTQPVNPFPRDGWFNTQYRLFGTFPGQDDYTPIAVPAALYKIVHWVAVLSGSTLRGELYLASLMQNGLLFLSGCLVYVACKRIAPQRVAGTVAVAFQLCVLSTGMAQAFWSENAALAMFAAVLYLNMKIYFESTNSSRSFWGLAVPSSVLIGLLVITRVTPIVLIPALLFLLYGRIDNRRLFNYATLLIMVAGFLVGAMLTSNYARFGRAELTHSSGRHLWQSVAPMINTALATSPEFLELKQLNPKIAGPLLQTKNWYAMRLPNDRRSRFDGEEMLGRLAREAIRNDPVLYLRLGLNRFITTIDQPPYRLGSDSKGDIPALAADPLKTDRPLPPLGAALLQIPASALSAADGAIKIIFAVGETVYQVAIFFVLTTYSAMMIQGLGSSGGSRAISHVRLWFALAGAAVLSLIYFNGLTVDRLQIWLVRSTCALIFLIQLAVIGRGGDARRDVRVIYTFLVLMFFGSLYLSWQIETNNTRNTLPYFPFLSVMVAAGIARWSGAMAKSAPR